MYVQGNMVLLDLDEHRDGPYFRMAASKVMKDPEPGDRYTVEMHKVDDGDKVLAIVRKCGRGEAGSRRVNAEKRISFMVPEGWRSGKGRKKNYGGYVQTHLEGLA